MNMKTTLPPSGRIGAELSGLDARHMTPRDAEHVRELLYRHKLVIFRKQDLSKAEYVELARKIGRPQIYFQKNYQHPEHPEIFVSGNVPDEKGRKLGVAGTGRYWHTDYQFFEEPLPFVMVYPQVLPTTGRGTSFIDMEDVYARLPSELRDAVEGRNALQEGKWRYKVTPEDIDKAIVDILAEVEKLVPPMWHPAVITHPVTKTKSLYVSRGFTTRIGELSKEPSDELLAKLLSFAERDEHVQTHTYEPGDILLWENRRMVHMASASPKGEASLSFRIGIYDDLPFYVK